MSSEPPPGSDQQPPEDDPLRKRPPSEPPDEGTGGPHGSEPPPYPDGGPGAGPDGGSGVGQDGGPGGGPPGDGPYGGGPYSGGPYGDGPYGGGPYPAAPVSDLPPLADGAKRTLARLIDLFLVGAVMWLVTWGLDVNEYDVDTDRIDVAKSLWRSVVAAVLYVAYDTVLTARTGQTLGKKLMGLRVVDLDSAGTPSAQNALTRAAVLWLPSTLCCPCLWLVVCGGWSFFNEPYKQGLHDKAAKTVVVSAN
ncbi:RDD family protein [Streptomyces sp. SudanB52_2052]|uniref:RDD family protein n=1 Tax=Streptomyces sp. SudanB52_2052 TaxID=3035276 RepID=UPI0004C56B36